MYKKNHASNIKKHLAYFLDFFPRVLLIAMPTRMWVQFEGGNKTRGQYHSTAHAVLSASARALCYDTLRRSSSRLGVTKWEVDQMGIDEVGIDKVGIDKVGINPSKLCRGGQSTFGGKDRTRNWMGGGVGCSSQ